METIFKNEYFNEFANKCLDNGLTILLPDDTDYWNFLTFSDGINIGYAQLDRYGRGIDFSTVNVPNKNCGTGFGLDVVADPTIEDIKKAFMFAPSWAKNEDRKCVVKYKSLEEYLKNPTNSSKRIITPKN